MIGNKGGHLVAGFGDRLQNVAQFGADFGSLIFERVVSFFQFMEVELLLVAVGKFDGRLLFLVFVDVLLLALFGGRAGFGFKLISERVDVCAAVGEDILDRQNLRT